MRAHLRERPAYYHIVHFDGHGGYGPAEVSGSAHLFRGYQGRLIFETEEGKPDEITAEQLSALLREYRIPVMVLNACQSAMVDSAPRTPLPRWPRRCCGRGFAAWWRWPIRCTSAAAQEFLPAFYQRLFETGNVAEAVRAGRQAMLRQPGRVCARGRFPLEDWLVPVVYQQEPPDLSFVGQRRVEDSAGTGIAGGGAGQGKPLRLYRSRRRAAGTGAGLAATAGGDTDSGTGRSGQDHAGPWSGAMAARHRRLGQGLLLVHLQRYSQQRVCVQPAGGRPVRHTGAGG